jgi:hypothetical protein
VEHAGISEEVRRQLRLVKVSNGDVDLSYFPDFLIIGPQRTGTTWLHAQLRFHPQIFLSEPKELYFFSSLKTRDPRRFVSDELSWYLQYFRDPLWRRAVKQGLSLWKYQQRYAPRVRGEGTTSYAALDPDVIAEIVALNPDVRAILMIRDPRLEDVPEQELRAFLTEPYQLRCAAYVEQYDQWSAQLRPGHLFTGLFDEINTRPEEFLLEVMRFLGVDADRRYVDRSVHEPVNPTAPMPIPPQYRAFLADLFKEDLAKLKVRFGLSWP